MLGGFEVGQGLDKGLQRRWFVEGWEIIQQKTWRRRERKPLIREAKLVQMNQSPPDDGHLIQTTMSKTSTPFTAIHIQQRYLARLPNFKLKVSFFLSSLSCPRFFFFMVSSNVSIHEKSCGLNDLVCSLSLLPAFPNR